MEFLKVLFILNAFFSPWACAGTTYGSDRTGTQLFVENSGKINGKTWINFNNDPKNFYQITIDKVVLDYDSDKVTCTLMAGGPNLTGLEVKCETKNPGNVVDVKATVYGCWDTWVTNPQAMRASDISFNKRK